MISLPAHKYKYFIDFKISDVQIQIIIRFDERKTINNERYY